MHPSNRFIPRRAALLPLLGLGACFLSTDHAPLPVASQLQIVAGDIQSDTVDQPLPLALKVRVLDRNGVPLGGVPVRYSTSQGGGTLFVVLDTTDLSGESRTSWRMPIVVGSYQAMAVVAGLDSVVFHASAVADRPQALVQVAGNNQIGYAGSTLDERVLVRVVDKFGNGVEGMTVGFTTASGNGRVLVPLARSDASGTAGTQWQLGLAPGSMQLRAKAPNIQSVPFDATALAPLP